MSEIVVQSTDALLALDSAMARAGSVVTDSLAATRNRTAQTKDKLKDREAECRRQLAIWQSRIDHADKQENTSFYQQQVAEWTIRLQQVRSWTYKIDEAERQFSGFAKRLEAIANSKAAQSHAFLMERVSEIEEYAALTMSGGQSSPLGGYSDSTAPAVSSQGYIRAAGDERDWLWSTLYGPPPADFPPACSLESQLGPVADQGECPCCVCSSLEPLMSDDDDQDPDDPDDFDPQDMYDQCQDPDVVGITIRNALRFATRVGFRSRRGRVCCLKGYARLRILDEIRHALSLGRSVLLGLRIEHRAFKELGAEGLAAIPKQTDEAHCMLAVGYDDHRQALRVRNSWGANWADRGHCWLPYAYLAKDPEFDAWTSVDRAPSRRSAREATTSNYAWFDPNDVALSQTASGGEDANLLQRIVAMRPMLDLNAMKGSNVQAIRDALVRENSNLAEDDLAAFDLYFGPDAIRIDADGSGRFLAVNGASRLALAQRLGIGGVPVSISNLARKLLRALIEGQ